MCDGGSAALTQTPSFAEHTRALAELTAIPQEIHRRWAEIIAAGGGAMLRLPLPRIMEPWGDIPVVAGMREVAAD